MIDVQNLKAKYEFWRARKLKLGKHYDFFFNLSNQQAIAVKILKKYPGVIVEYSEIHMSTDQDMSFDFNVIANPNLCDTESNRFKRYTSAIFRNIILRSIENAVKEENENRNANSIKSNPQRSVHEEDLTVFEERVPDRKPRKKAIRGNKKLHSQV
jgi:hypothetical protein